MTDMDIQPLPKGQKVGTELQLYAGRVMPSTFGQCIEFAQMMCKAGAAVPKHYRDNPGACLALIQRCLAWEIDPWGAATKTYFVNDQIAFESQLVAAVIKKWAPIKEKVIPYKYDGDGENMRCSVVLHHAETGEEIPYVSPKIKDIQPRNSPLWKTDPQQQLGYYTIRAWSRRHFPEILMGVYDRDEVLAMRDITPAPEKQAVDNFLHDEEPVRQIEQPREDPVVIVIDPVPQDERMPSAVEQGRFETEAAAVQVTPQLIAQNLIKGLASCTSKIVLEDWQGMNHAAINELPDGLRAQVRSALDRRHMELEEL